MSDDQAVNGDDKVQDEEQAEEQAPVQSEGKQEVAPTENDAPNKQMQTPLGTPAKEGNQGS